MFELIKEKFIGLLIGLFNRPNHTKFASSSNQKCMTQPTLFICILVNTVKIFTTIHLRSN